MDIYNKEIPLKSLPFDLKDCRDELGLVKSAVIKCPGVYWLHMLAISEGRPSFDFYAVMEDAPISKEARTYGKWLPTHPELLLYQIDETNFSHKIIEYEIFKFYIKNNLPTPENETLRSLAAYAMEVCPSYFGTYPAPTVTPWGYTTRYKTLNPGVFWIETDQCAVTLAVSCVMQDDLSERVYGFARLTDFDKAHGLDKTMGYLFFQEKTMCLAIFELMRASSKSQWSMINVPALMNVIWRDFPEYAAEYNYCEQAGKHDILGNLLRIYEPHHELKSCLERMVSVSLDAGFDFLRF